MLNMNSREVTSPDGMRWSVTRRWFAGRRLHSWKWRLEQVSDAPGSGSANWFDAFQGDDLWSALLTIGAIVVLALVVVPILLFGIELVSVGVLIAAGLSGQMLLGKPWTIEARAVGDGAAASRLWRIAGWRDSHRFIAHVRDELAAGRGLPPDPELLAQNDTEPAGGSPTGPEADGVTAAGS
jgi:hypothetical protein